MKIVFLDIDGVVICTRAEVAFDKLGKNKVPDPSSVGLVRQLLSIEPDTQLVICSSWGINGSREGICAMLGDGFAEKLHDDWRVLTDYHQAAGAQVEMWLKRHPDVDGFVCLDDEGETYKGLPLVLTDQMEGFLFKDFLKASKMLFGDEDAWLKTRQRRANAQKPALQLHI